MYVLNSASFLYFHLQPYPDDHIYVLAGLPVTPWPHLVAKEALSKPNPPVTLRPWVIWAESFSKSIYYLQW